MEKKLLIVDGTSILAEAYYKSLTKEVEAFHSLRESGKVFSTQEEELAFSTLLQSKKGVSINAVQGFFRVLFDALDKTNPTHLIVTWGAQREDNFRRKIFPGYKDDGKIKDKELLNQETLTQNLLKDIGICQLESKNSEALDLAGSLISKYKKEFKVELLARNTLALQFTNDATVWLRIPNFKDIERRFSLDCSCFPENSIRFDEEFLLKYKNLKPHQLPDYRALIGNSFSKIPGVKAVGEVTTLALLEEYGCIENIYADIDSCTSQHELVDFGNSLTKYLTLPFNPIPFLVKGRDEAFLGKQLATYERNEASVLLTALTDFEFNLDSINKVDIVKKLKSVCLAPITCNITKGLAEIIENLNYSSLIVTYNYTLLSNSSDVFAGFIENVNSLDSFEFELVPCSDFKDVVNISDRAIISLGSKIKFTLPEKGHYSKESIMNRVAEQIEETSNITEETLSIPQTNCKAMVEKSNEQDVSINDKDIPISNNEVSISNNDVSFSDENTATSNNETSISDKDISVSNKDASISDENTSKLNTIEEDKGDSEIHSKTNNLSNTGLSLLEQLVINKYVCHKCGEEFLLVNSTADYCVKCGIKSELNNN